MKRTAYTAGFVLLVLGSARSAEPSPSPEGGTALSSLAEKAMALKSHARTEIDSSETPLFEHVTREITSRMEAGRVNVPAAPAMGGAFPTIGRRCATTAPTCGRPTMFGCRPRVTLVNCFRTTAITCGCPPTTAPTCGQPTFINCAPKVTVGNCPPPTTAPTCGQPTFGCPPRTTMAGCPPMTTAITCNRP